MSDPKIESLEMVRLKYVALVFKYCQGSKIGTARKLGIARETVYNLLEKCKINGIDLTIDVPRFSLARKQLLKHEIAKLFYPLPTNDERLNYLNSMLNKKDVFTTRIEFL